MEIASIGIDLGKTTFHLVALNHQGKVVVRRKFSRKQLLAYTANLPVSLIGLEACSGAHFLGAALRDQGHEVRLIPAQFVKPFLKSNKNDFLDAEAIAEAVARQNMRFVPIKTDDQLDLQALHRVRDRLVHRRTAVINQIRGFLLERGIVFAKGPVNLRNQMPAILEDAEQTITPRMRNLLAHLWEEWKGLIAEIERLSEEIDRIGEEDAACRRLRQIPGVGPLVATATVAAIGNGAAFRKGREFAAWLGLVPRQHSTGGRARGSVEYNQGLSERRVNRAKRFLVEQGVPADNIEIKAYGKQQNLSDAEVKDAVERNPELSAADREKVLKNMRTIILASNRRVDITLTNAGQAVQESVREYPFNAADSLTLLDTRGGTGLKARPAVKKKPAKKQ